MPWKATQKFRSDVGMGKCRAESRLDCCMEHSRFTESQDPSVAPTAYKQAVRAPSAGEQGDPSSWALPALQPQESQLAPGKEYFFPRLPLIRESPQTLSGGQQTTALQKNSKHNEQLDVPARVGCKRCNREHFLSHALSCIHP